MSLFKKKSLEQHLSATKRVKVEGIIFEIKKIDPLSHLQGINALQKVYDTYKVGKGIKNLEQGIEAFNSVKKICREIILAGVVSPKISAKADGSGFFVDEILKDLALSQKLAEHIIKFTYKKKLMSK